MGFYKSSKLWGILVICGRLGYLLIYFSMGIYDSRLSNEHLGLLIYFSIGIYDSILPKEFIVCLGLLIYFSMGSYESKSPNGLYKSLGLLISFNIGSYDSRELNGLFVCGLAYFLGRLAVNVFLFFSFFSNNLLWSMLKLDMFWFSFKTSFIWFLIVPSPISLSTSFEMLVLAKSCFRQVWAFKSLVYMLMAWVFGSVFYFFTLDLL